MNLKVKAALQTAGFFAAVSAAAVGIDLLQQVFTPEQIGTGLTGLFLCIAGYFLFQVNLSRLESQENAEKLIAESKEILAKYR